MLPDHNFIHNVSSNSSNEVVYLLKQQLFRNKSFHFFNNWRLKINDRMIIDYFKMKYGDCNCTTLYTSSYIYWSEDWIICVDKPGYYMSLDEEPTEMALTISVYANDFDKSKQLVSDFYEHFKSEEVSAQKLTVWASLAPDGKIMYTTMNLKSYDFKPEFYPYINNMDIDGLIKDFQKSKSNVLILTGDPGLGKSSFIKQILQVTGWNSVVAYDQQVMQIDDFYIDFIAGSKDVMILEDADLLLQSRIENGNKIMSKILNVSDGIIDTGKKFIFTANLSNIEDIDEALIRPGRCFDIIRFRQLNFDEAEFAASSIGKELFDKSKNKYSVAEIYNSKTTRENIIPIRKIGFA